MFIHSLPELLIIVMAAMVLDWLFGDPRWMPHPVVMMGRWIAYLERSLNRSATRDSAEGDSDTKNSAATGLASTHSVTTDSAATDCFRYKQKWRGVLLVMMTLVPVLLISWVICAALHALHPWLGYAAEAWLISTTIAMKGLRQAAYNVYVPLKQGDLQAARQKVGEIVGRKTDQLDESGITRATVETVAENTVDAVISPLFFALLGGAPLAMLYRGTNTLDSMVGYKNDRYIDFGWASARWDDLLNWIPARITGVLLATACFGSASYSGKRALQSIRQFAHLHMSPNSGIPESAVAGALGIQLGGRNVYGSVVSERAELGFAIRERRPEDIVAVCKLMNRAGILTFGGLLCASFIALLLPLF